MWSKNGRFLAVGLAALGLLLPTHAASADRTEAIAQLEARADDLHREILIPPKKGRLLLSKLRTEARAIETEIARLESGGAVDSARLASLIEPEAPAGPVDADAIAKRSVAKRENLKRRVVAGPKVGALYRQAVRQDIRRLDRIIAELESGQDVDPIALRGLLGIAIADARKSPEERLRESELRLASLERELSGGPKEGFLRRAAIRDEIEALDSLIDRLEKEVQR